jgi:hypothetical protein
MTLTLPTGAPFAIGVTGYDYRPATSHETTPRLVVEVALERIVVEASASTELFCKLLPPGIAGLQPGSGSHAGAWRSQDTPQMSTVKALVLQQCRGDCVSRYAGYWHVRGATADADPLLAIRNGEALVREPPRR